MKTKTILIILIILLILGYTGGWWGGQWYFDSGNYYFHFAGGFFVALLITSYYSTEFRKLSQPFRFFCVIGLTIAVAVFWEFHEYALGRLIGISLMGDLTDTIKDLLMGTLGAITAAFVRPFHS